MQILYRFCKGCTWELCWKAHACSSHPNSWCGNKFPTNPEELFGVVVQLPAGAERQEATPGFPSHQLDTVPHATIERLCEIIISVGNLEKKVVFALVV